MSCGRSDKAIADGQLKSVDQLLKMRNGRKSRYSGESAPLSGVNFDFRAKTLKFRAQIRIIGRKREMKVKNERKNARLQL